MDEKIDLRNVCRTCLVAVDNNRIFLFDGSKLQDGIHFNEMLEECTSVTIQLDDEISKFICEKCSAVLELSYKFRIQSISNDNKLKDLYVSSQSDYKCNEKFNLKEENDFDHSHVDIKLENDEIDIKDEIYIKIEADDFGTDTIQDDLWRDTGNKKKKLRFRKRQRQTKSIKSVKCEDCDTLFASNEDYTNHVKEQHGQGNIYECDECGKPYKTAWTLSNHKLRHGFHCKICLEKFDSEDELNEHRKKHASQENYECKWCKKIFFFKRRLLIHMRTHTNDRRHLCVYCGKAFVDNANLNTHMRIHNGQRPYNCTFCGAGFAQWSSLRSHLITHTHEKNYACPVCDKRVSRTSALRRHILTHTDERKYPCTICSKNFKSSSELKKHTQIHSGEKNFKCVHCGKAFNRADNLRVHCKIHTGEKPHVCSVCGRGYIQRHVLISHLRTHAKN